MKIAYINPTTIMRRPITELANIFSKKHSVTVFTPKNFFNKKLNLHYTFNKKVKIEAYQTVNFVNSMEWPIPISPSFFIKLHNIFKKNDVVHMWTYSYIVNFFTLLYSKFYNTKLILTYDTVPGISLSLGKFDYLYKVFYLIFSKFIFNNPDKISVYGKSIKNISRKLTNKKINVIPTGTNIPVKKTKSIRKEFNLENKPIILFVGRIAKIKGIDTIFKVANDKRMKNFVFLMVGSNLNKKIYEQYKSKKPNNVIFTGSRSDIYNFYSEANLFFLPSKGEGMPGVIMEAMKFGLPIVTSKIPGTSDLITRELALTNKNYTNSIIKIISDKNLHKKMSNFSKKESKKYNWTKISKNYFELYSN